jgi:hypothetical protein
MSAPPVTEGAPADAYARLEERILARDQIGASQVFYGLLKDGRPLDEMLRETVRIHAPYTHVPYHQRLDDGVARFVNNDHCLLSARATLRLNKLVAPELRFLPLAQTMWYIPTGLDPWNQLIGKAPGHYARMYQIDYSDKPPTPEVHWEDQQPLHLDGGTFDEKLNEWLTLVQRGEVLKSYQVFLGLFEDQPNRRKLLSHLAFAGLIDVQDRMIYNRSYTTGHKSFRARATIELGDFLGWDKAHSVLYAGVPDIAVGPRWYSNYEMACQINYLFLDNNDQAYLQNSQPLTTAESEALLDLLLQSHEPAWTYHLVDLLKAGKGIKDILQVIQVASAELILQTADPTGYSMPQHSFEYCNTLRWFYDSFEHPHQVKLLFVAASFVNQAAHHQAIDARNAPLEARIPRGAESLSQQQLLERIDASMLALQAEESVALTRAYLQNGFDRETLVRSLATTTSKYGNDPHNQEIGLCLLEDYGKSTAWDRDRLLLACAKHGAGHRKYGDPLESFRRFAEAIGVETRQESRGDAPAEEALLDD